MSIESIQQIRTFLEQAKQLPNYEPSEEVNSYFIGLCAYARGEDNSCPKERNNCDAKFDFSIPEVKELQQICALAEEKMEKFWSKKIAQSPDPRSALSEFIYYRNYEKLTQLEYYLLLSQLSKLEKVLFVGSGALPLTAILLAQYGVKSTLIERDEEAYILSVELIKKLGLEETIQIIHTDFLEFRSQEHFDGIWMASLLFTNTDADKLLTYLQLSFNFDLVVIRTVEGFKQLLYQKVPLELVKKYFTLELEVHPKNEILNSLLLCSNIISHDKR